MQNKMVKGSFSTEQSERGQAQVSGGKDRVAPPTFSSV
ncbi:hypothetical protein L345_06963, partial [Ophiophagus hannah]